MLCRLDSLFSCEVHQTRSHKEADKTALLKIRALENCSILFLPIDPTFTRVQNCQNTFSCQSSNCAPFYWISPIWQFLQQNRKLTLFLRPCFVPSSIQFNFSITKIKLIVIVNNGRKRRISETILEKINKDGSNGNQNSMPLS